MNAEKHRGKHINNTADAVIYRKRKGKESNDENEYEYEILLIQRKNPPFQGNFALPGGFVEYNESVEEACIREAKEETNLDVQIEKLIGVYSKPDRDPRGHTITAAFLCIPPENLYPLAGDDAKNAKFFRISEILNMQLTSFRSDISKSDDFKMAFDHKYIIEDALKFLKEKR